MYQQDLTWLEGRWRAFWAKENHDRPIMTVYAPNGKTSSVSVKEPATVEERYLDPDFVIPNFRRGMEQTWFGGEAFPLFWPNVGTDILAGLAGCELFYAPDTVWAKAYVEDWDTLPPFTFDENNRYFQKALELIRAAVADSGGDYIIGNTDIHPGLDALSALRGSEMLCFDYIESRDQLIPRLKQIFELQKQLFTKLDDAIALSGQTGTSCWFNLYHPDKKWYPTSCDVSCMISPDDFEELVVPFLQEELKFFDASIYHLDGTVALHHLDRLLAIPELDGIQWVPGVGKPSAAHWVDVMKKVQDAGKLLTVEAESPDDLRAICENLRPEGVCVNMYAPNREVGEQLLQMAVGFCAERRKKS